MNEHQDIVQGHGEDAPPPEATYDAGSFPALERYRSGDPAYDYDLFGAALAVLQDAHAGLLDEPSRRWIMKLGEHVQRAQDAFEPFTR